MSEQRKQRVSYFLLKVFKWTNIFGLLLNMVKSCCDCRFRWITSFSNLVLPNHPLWLCKIRAKTPFCLWFLISAKKGEGRRSELKICSQKLPLSTRTAWRKPLVSMDIATAQKIDCLITKYFVSLGHAISCTRWKYWQFSDFQQIFNQSFQ